MTCHDARELFSAWMDEALNASERATVDEHLRGCAECRSDLERFQRTVALLHEVEPARAPAGFVDRVLDASHREPWYRRFLRRLFWPLHVKLPIEAMAVLLVAIGAVYVYQKSPELQQAARPQAPYAVSPAPEPPATAEKPALKPAPPESELAQKQEPSLEGRSLRGERANGSADRAANEREAAPPPGVPADKKAEAREKVGRMNKVEVGGKLDAQVESPPARESRPAEQERVPGQPPTVEQPRGPEPLREGQRGAEQGRPPDGPSRTEEHAARDRSGSAGRAADVRKDALREEPRKESAKSAPAPSETRMAARPQAPADVSGRLSAQDPAEAARAVRELVARLGGQEVSRRFEATGAVLEMVVSRDAYPGLMDGLRRIGQWLPDREVAPLPAQVRVTLRITD